MSSGTGESTPGSRCAANTGASVANRAGEVRRDNREAGSVQNAFGKFGGGIR